VCSRQHFHAPLVESFSVRYKLNKTWIRLGVPSNSRRMSVARNVALCFKFENIHGKRHLMTPAMKILHIYIYISAFFNYISGGQLPPPRERIRPPPPVKPFLPPKWEAELLMIAVGIAVDLLDNEIMPFHSLLHSHLVCDSYCSSPSIS
jgi:hypothetical protein